MSHPLNPGSSATIFERCGGFAKVSRIVMSFYDRVGDSEILAPYFETTDMRVLVDHQTKFVASLMGGPASYGDETLRHVHARLAITHEAFDEMTLLLRETFEDFDMAEADIAAVMGEIERSRPLIVTA
ncbi:group 1 truncated hemoglobin [Kaustia mangrovi]|uniref:Group 1 truncated hemoglobin n=1 Tax=Kaustia mangrovi TaxID=2593653 RepID=A0A7S8C7Y2_9HYPH|nr:group 1 truncated hemoglobin [Kaustia mangrovi]QPC45070.1 group 1 truncated hemoglobin [Kaustia mangrovi]